MYWPGCQEADQYYGSAPYHMQQPNSGEGCYDHAGYYYGSSTVTMTGDFFVPDEQVADPSFMLDLNLDFEDQEGGVDVPAACKRKQENQKGESTACTVPKKKSRSTAVPVSSSVSDQGVSISVSDELDAYDVIVPVFF
jgi:hypothetical protein